MKDALIVWSIIILVIVSIIFPPFGYTKITVHTIPKDSRVPSYEHQMVVPWTYVGHRFILSKPPRHDRNLDKIFKSDYYDIEVAILDDVGIAWTIFAIQVAVSILVAGGVAFSLRTQRKSTDT